MNAMRRRSITRGIAWFLGGLIILNLVGELRTPGFDSNLWLLDVPFPRPIAGLMLLAAGAGLLVWAVRPSLPQWTRRAATTAIALAALTAAWNAVSFFRIWRTGDIDPMIPIPLSVIWAGLFAWLGWEIHSTRTDSRGSVWWIVGALVASVLAFPVLQVAFFGSTDYRRPVDAAVVFGARVYDNGRASPSLEARVRTAVDLYHEGLSPILIMSGGRGPNGFDEALVMRDLAVELAVPSEAIVIDTEGNNTEATVEHTMRHLSENGLGSIAAVSHFYHLPRIQLAFQRRGLDVVTVPANQYQRIAKTPISVLREVPAFWIYYLKATFG